MCAFLHWPLERESAHRKALLAATPHAGPCDKCRKRAKEAEWSAVVKAVKYLSKAADAGHLCAVYNLGLLLEAGFESAQDMAAAAEWLKGKGAEMGPPKMTLAHFNKNRKIKMNKSKREKNATPRADEEAAGGGDEGVLERMRVGCGAEGHVLRARALYAAAARHGLACARCLLGLRSLCKARAPSERQEGAVELLSASAQTEPAALFGLGLVHLFNRTPEMSDAEECRRRAYGFFSRAAQLGHRRASFNAGMCAKLGIGTEPDPARARAFFRAGVQRMDARCAVELADYHLESDFAHASPAIGVRLLREAWRLGQASVATKLAELYSEGRAVDKDLALATAWLAQVDASANAATTPQQQAASSASRAPPFAEQPEPIRYEQAVGILQVHGDVVREAVEAALSAPERTWRLLHVLQALCDRALLPFAFASDVVAAIASRHFGGSGVDLQRGLSAETLGTVFPFWSRNVGETDAFYGQAQLRDLYSSQPLVERRLRAMASMLFKQMSRNFSTPEQAFLRYSRPESRCHVLVDIALKGLGAEQCDERWQQALARVLERLVQVGMLVYQRRRVDAGELEQEYRRFRQVCGGKVCVGG